MTAETIGYFGLLAACDLVLVESTLLTELNELLDKTIATARQVTDADTAWDKPEEHSPAGQELAAAR